MIKQSYEKDMVLCNDAEFCRENKIGVSIIYAYENSDVFYPAKLLRHGRNCLCFASNEPITMGENIYILTQDFPIEGANLRIYEGCFAQVEECKKTDNFKNNPSIFNSRGISGRQYNEHRLERNRGFIVCNFIPVNIFISE